MDSALRHFALVVFALAAAFGFAVSVSAAELTEADRQFLAIYEKIRAALAADNLKDAKAAATELKEVGAAIAQSESIITARKEFAALSERALKLAKGQEGYYHAHCPMLQKDWVQTSTKISNPYDAKMPNCGTIRR